jgi:hypothetical protein
MGSIAGNVGAATMSVSARALDRSGVSRSFAACSPSEGGANDGPLHVPGPVVRPLEPGEEWCSCNKDEITFRVDLAKTRS